MAQYRIGVTLNNLSDGDDGRCDRSIMRLVVFGHLSTNGRGRSEKWV